MLYWLVVGGPLPFESKRVVEKHQFLARHPPSTAGQREGQDSPPGKPKPIYPEGLSVTILGPLKHLLSFVRRAEPGLKTHGLGKAPYIPPLKRGTDEDLVLLSSGNSATVNSTSFIK